MRRAKTIVIAFVAIVALHVPTAAQAAPETPTWKLRLIAVPTNLKPGTTGTKSFAPIYLLLATNIGTKATTGTVTMQATFPTGVVPKETNGGKDDDSSVPDPACKVDGQSLICTTAEAVNPSRWIAGRVGVEVSGALSSGARLPDATASITGGGAAPVSTSTPTLIDDESPSFGFLEGENGFASLLTNADGTPSTQAGSHPDQVTIDIGFPIEQSSPSGAIYTGAGHPRDIVTELPRGMIINPQATERCTEAELLSTGCPNSSQVGVVSVVTAFGDGPRPYTSSLYNMVPSPGTPATFAFNVAGLGLFAHLEGGVRSDGDYGLTALSADMPARGASPILGVQAQLWGDPTSSSHDQIRGEKCREFPSKIPSCPVERKSTAFLTMPSQCTGPIPFGAKARSWEEAAEGITGLAHSTTAQTTDAQGSPVGVTGCDLQDFNPTLTVQPDSDAADTPTGLHVKLHLPQADHLTTRQGELEPLNEVQTLSVKNNAPNNGKVPGTFVLGFKGQLTSELSYGATAPEVQDALASLSTVGAGNVSVSGGPAGAQQLVITYINKLGDLDVPQLGAVFKSETTAEKVEVLVSTTTQGRPTGETGTLAGPAIAPANLRDATVTLPKGLVVNPAQADGLGACSPEQIGLTTPVGQSSPIHFTKAPDSCPDAAKVGSVEVTTPLLDHPLPGSVFLAKPFDNPFGSLVAIYLSIDDPQSGTVSKLAGRVSLDPDTGQLTNRFEENPELPLEDVKLDLFPGARASLTTPQLCGRYTTSSDLTPWSAPEGEDAHPRDSFAIGKGANGASCISSEEAAPNAPAFSGGTVLPVAGAYTPLVMSLSRPDGSQRLGGFDLTLPPGLSGRLAGVAICSDAQIAQAASRGKPEEGRLERDDPSCPANAALGTVDAAAGSGPSPIHTRGTVYLAGPYKGAPLSIVTITPAIAGPFDLGTVVVRAALYVDPVTARIHAVSDRFPTILHGIPLDLRSVSVEMSRDRFTLNPTSCERMALTGSASSAFGQAIGLSNPFQVGGCKGLDFEPKLAIMLKGGTRRSKNPSLTATLTMPSGSANIAKASVLLPHSEFLDQAHIRTVCTRVQFAAAACPPGAVYGHARAFTPLLDDPLEGPVYLRSSSHPLPDLVAALKGPARQPIEVVLDGRVDSVNGGIRNTFEAVPDQPVSKFVLEMQGGKKGLLVNSADLCRLKAEKRRATARFDGQNGKSYEFKPVVQNSCKKKHRKQKRHGRHAPR